MRCRSVRPLASAAAAAITVVVALGAVSPTARAAIYTCVAPDGRRLTSDRAIPECVAREQQIRNTDGSVKQVVPPSLTTDERNEADAAERRKQAERIAQADAVRRDRSLLIRYPTEASHQKARESALDDVRAAVKASQDRDVALSRERKPLLDEAEFYKSKAMPQKLKEQLDANDAAVEAQRSLAQNQTAERDRINALYDAELARLKRLWAGAQPGSLGPLNSESSAQPMTGTAARK
jgi:hypothetical protein